MKQPSHAQFGTFLAPMLALLAGCSLLIPDTSFQDAGSEIDGSSLDATTPTEAGIDADVRRDASVDAFMPDAGPDETSPTVLSLFPEAGAVAVELDVQLRVVFSEDMDTSTLSASSFRLSYQGEEIPGTVSYDAASRTSRFVPDEPLVLLREYTALLTTGVADLAGNLLTAEQRWSFVARDGRWTSPVRLDSMEQPARFTPKLMADRAGNALAVWSTSGVTPVRLAARRYVRTDGAWQPTVELDQGIESVSGFFSAAVNPSGSAAVAWSEAGSSRVMIRRMDTAGVWDDPVEVAPAGGSVAAEIVLALDHVGNSTIMWMENFDLKWTRCPPSGACSPAQTLLPGLPSSSRYAQNLAVDVDQLTNVTASWQFWDGASATRAQAARIPSGTMWEIEDISTSSAAGGVQLSTSPDGSVTAVWRQEDAGRQNMWANRYELGSGWGSAQLIEVDNANDVIEWQVTSSLLGEGLCYWSYAGSDRSYSTNRYEPGTGWRSPERIDNTENAIALEARFGPDDNLLAVWHEWVGTVERVYSSRYQAGSGWLVPQRVDAAGADAGSTRPSLVVGRLGRALMSWKESHGGGIWAANFD